MECPDYTFRYMFVDLSDPLLRSSICATKDWLYKHDLECRIITETVHHDMLELQHAEAHRLGLRKGKNAIWFLTAGTIGSLDEEAFRDSISKKARSGDLLVVAAHTYDASGHDKNARDAVEATYISDEMNQILYTPVAEVLKALNLLDMLPGEVVENLRPKMPSRGEPDVSKIPLSRSAVWEFDGSDGPVTLLKSSRYDTDEFI